MLGHELRAAHHSYFWLLIFRDALNGLLAHEDDVTAMASTVKKHVTAKLHHIPPAPLVNESTVVFEDNIQCFTTFEPRADPDMFHLLKLVIPSEGKGVVSTKPAFQVVVMEDLMPNLKETMIKGRLNGGRDYKYIIYGDANSSPLSLKINPQKLGVGLICQHDGLMRTLPDGFKFFWEVETKMYLTENVVEVDKFVFAVERAKLMKYTFVELNGICVTFDEKLTPGSHVLTIVPTTADKVMFTYLLLP